MTARLKPGVSVTVMRGAYKGVVGVVRRLTAYPDGLRVANVAWGERNVMYDTKNLRVYSTPPKSTTKGKQP